MQNSLYKLFEQMCVGSVCTHPSYNDKNQQSAESLAFKATWTKKWLAENRADFDRVKRVFFTLPLRNFNQSML